MSRLTTFLAAAAVVILIAGTAVVLRLEPSRQADCGGGLMTGNAAIGGPFELVTDTGETVTDAEVLDEPALIYFGYTFCPDVCPLDAARNARAVDILAERGFDVRPVFITIDPARDTPEVLAAFTDYMHPDMLGLTGSEEQVRRAASAYRVYYAQRGDDPASYLMNHSVYTYLDIPGKGFVDLFRGAPGAGSDGGTTAEEVAKRTECHLRHS